MKFSSNYLKSERNNSLMANVKGDLSSFLKLPFLFKSFFQHYISGFAVWRVDGQMTCLIETHPRKTGHGQMTVPPKRKFAAGTRRGRHKSKKEKHDDHLI